MNIDLFQLFTEGEYYLLAGNCAAVVPIKDKIMQSPSRLPPNRCPRCTRVGCWTHRVCVFLARESRALQGSVAQSVLCLWSEVGHPHGGGSRFGAVILHDYCMWLGICFFAEDR